ncbi:hypothetical protein J7J39_00985 [bacterium]|nr:hypothetical protein [bacterium]
MAKKFIPKLLPWHFPKKKSEEGEKGKKDIIVCPECEAFYWYKSWHHSLDEYPELRENKEVKFELCPACKMTKEGKFEGEVILENVPEKIREELVNFINNFNEEENRRDPLARIISVEDIAKGMIRVTFTQNQLAKKLAKRLKKTYKTQNRIIFSKKDKTIRAFCVFG